MDDKQKRSLDLLKTSAMGFASAVDRMRAAAPDDEGRLLQALESDWEHLAQAQRLVDYSYADKPPGHQCYMKGARRG